MIDLLLLVSCRLLAFKQDISLPLSLFMKSGLLHWKAKNEIKTKICLVIKSQREKKGMKFKK